MTFTVHRLCHLTAFALFVLIMTSLVGEAALQVIISPPEDPTNMSRNVFAHLSDVYRSGGNAPDLVARLNAALELIDEGRLKRLNGEESQAVLLEEKARVIMTGIVDELPAAQQRAQRDATAKILLVVITVPVVVVLSTSLFFAALRTWRWYEKTKLFEMEIVEKKKEKD